MPAMGDVLTVAENLVSDVALWSSEVNVEPATCFHGGQAIGEVRVLSGPGKVGGMGVEIAGPEPMPAGHGCNAIRGRAGEQVFQGDSARPSSLEPAPPARGHLVDQREDAQVELVIAPSCG